MIIVTGGFGFIGSHLVRALKATEEVIVVDKPESLGRYPDLANVPFWTPDALYRLNSLKEKPTAIYHLGGISSTRAEGPELFKTNTELTLLLWRWCAKHDVPFLYASSAATYGNGSVMSDRLSVYELMTLAPLNAYGRSKHLADIGCHAEQTIELQPPPRWYGCKFFNVYGPGEWHKGPQRSLVTRWLETQAAGFKLEIFGGTFSAARDFVAVSDAVEVMIWLMTAKPQSGIYNVGTGQITSLGALIAAVQGNDYPDKDKVEFIEAPFGLLENSYQWHTCADTQKLRDAGYPGYPMKTVREGILDYGPITEFGHA